MDFELSDEHRMLRDLVRSFVDRELLPHEPGVLAREAAGQSQALPAEDQAAIDAVSRELGLWGLDAPEDVGGVDLPAVAMVAVNEEMGRTVVPYTLPPDSPNLRMLVAAADARQREAYLEPYVRGETISAIGISEPDAGSDPSRMSTTAVLDGDTWVLNGRKVWITRAAEADFTIVLAVTDRSPEGRNRLSAFLVDRDTPGLRVVRPIPMVGGQTTYELTLDDCRVPAWKLLGTRGEGFAPMQLRLGTRRVEMAAWSVGMAQRALEMMTAYASLRTTFGEPLAKRQTVQGWITDAATGIHAARLMTYHCAWALDQGRDVRREISMIKAYAVEMAYDVVDHAMQAHGALGVTRELPLHLMASRLRTMRIYDGPTEVHRWVVARDVLARHGRA